MSAATDEVQDESRAWLMIAQRMVEMMDRESKDRASESRRRRHKARKESESDTQSQTDSESEDDKQWKAKSKRARVLQDPLDRGPRNPKAPTQVR